MTRWVAFYAPMKPPDHLVPSGDRRMARLLMAALDRAGLPPILVNRFRSWDDGTRPERPRRLARIGQWHADRIASHLAADPPRLWFTYHLYHKAPDWLGPRVSARLNIPYVVAEASCATRQAQGPWASGYAAARAAIVQADRLFVLNRADIPGLRPLLNDPDRLIMLPPFLDLAADADIPIPRATGRGAMAVRFGLDPAVPWLLTVAMMRPGDKARSYAVLAAALAVLTDRPWQLLVIGDGRARPAVEAGFAAIADRVRYAGVQDAAGTRDGYHNADLFVWPAINEAYGMAILEAQAAGLPVVAGRAGGVGDIVTDAVTGRLVAMGDAEALAAAVAQLLDDPARRAALSVAARHQTRTHHGLDAAAAVLRAALAELAR